MLRVTLLVWVHVTFGDICCSTTHNECHVHFEAIHEPPKNYIHLFHALIERGAGGTPRKIKKLLGSLAILVQIPWKIIKLQWEEEGGGGDALWRDATFAWSRAKTHPPRCNKVILGLEVPGVRLKSQIRCPKLETQMKHHRSQQCIRVCSICSGKKIFEERNAIVSFFVANYNL